MNEVNLLESTTLEATIHCMLPGAGCDVWRPFDFTATFIVLDEKGQDELNDKELSVRDYLRAVVQSVGPEIPAAKDPVTGEDVSPKEVAIRNAFTMDAMFGVYQTRLGKNSRDEAIRSVDAKNSKRSRKR